MRLALLATPSLSEAFVVEHPSAGSASRAILPSEATASWDAETQQRIIIEEEERSTEALAGDGRSTPTVEGAMPNVYAHLVSRGLALTAERLELQATMHRIRAAANAARESAIVTRNESVSLRFRCVHRWIKA